MGSNRMKVDDTTGARMAKAGFGFSRDSESVSLFLPLSLMLLGY